MEYAASPAPIRRVRVFAFARAQHTKQPNRSRADEGDLALRQKQMTELTGQMEYAAMSGTNTQWRRPGDVRVFAFARAHTPNSRTDPVRMRVISRPSGKSK